MRWQLTRLSVKLESCKVEQMLNLLYMLHTLVGSESNLEKAGRLTVGSCDCRATLPVGSISARPTVGWVAETAALLDSMQGKQKLVIKCHSGSGG